MPHKIIFSDQAAEKLILIFNDIETRFGKRSKDLVKKEFQKTIISASVFPEIGKIYDKHLRYVIVKKRSILFYRFENNTMYIVAVFSSKENWMSKI